MIRILLTALMFFSVLCSYAQSNVEWFTNNPDMEYEAGETFTFTIVVTNNGPTPATNVNVFYPVPTGLNIPPVTPLQPQVIKFWWTASNGASGNNNNPLNYTLPLLGAYQTMTFTVNIMIPNGYTADLPDPTVTWNANTNIVVVNTNNQDTYTPGTQSVYTVQVTNAGAETAYNVAVSNPLPAGITSSSWTGNSTSGTGALNNIIDELSPGETVTYTVTMNIPAGFTGNLVSQVSTAGPVTDPVPACPQCTDTDVPNAGANIVVTNTNNQSVYIPGTVSTYTITVTNQGPADATNVNVVNNIPAGILVSSWSGSNGSSGTNANLTDVIPTLTAGSTVTYTLNLTIPPTYTGELTSQTTVTSSTTDPVPACPLCTDTDVDATNADIEVSQTLNSGTTYAAGNTAVYTIIVSNNGPTAASNVDVSSLLPAGISAGDIFWSGSNGSYGTGLVNDVIDVLPNGATVTYTVTFDIPADYTGDLVHQVDVASATIDPVPGCAECTHTATQTQLANIVTVKTNNQTSYMLNEQVTYTITITNLGPNDAQNVTVYDPVPYNIDVMSWSGNNDGGGGSLNDVIAVLPAGETMVYTVTLLVPDDHAEFVGNLVNTVNVTSGTTDPAPGCVACTDTDTPRSEDFITVTTNQYTVPELVTDVLIDLECVNISNINWSTGAAFGAEYGIGYFHANNSNFPIQSGIVLTSANALDVPGPNTQGLGGSFGWPGDNDLEDWIAPGDNTFGASYIEFDFVPVADNMSFRFMFASEEYGTPSFECNYSDVFAFILTNLDTGEVTNLAFLEGTDPPVPILVTTVHPANGFCGAANPTFFGQYNNGAAAATAPIDFNGQMIVMTASSQVVPGDNYHIKLVIANEGDNALSSGVFLEAGSFDIGQPVLPADLSFANDQAVCASDTADITVEVDPQFNIEWLHDGVLIVDNSGNPVTSTTITVTEPGVYTVNAFNPIAPGCVFSDEILVEFYPELPVNEPNDITICASPDGVNTIDLTQVEDEILGGFDPNEYEFYYYPTLEAYQNDDPPIWPPTAYNVGPDDTTLYVAVVRYDVICFTLKEFNVNIIDNPELPQQDDVEVCGSYELPVLAEGNYYTGPGGTGTQLSAGDIITTSQTLYVYVANTSDDGTVQCSDEEMFEITITAPPVLENADPIIACDDDFDGILTFDLTASVDQILENYPDYIATIHLTEDDAVQNINPQPVIVSVSGAQIFYVRAYEAGAPNCYSLATISITVNPKPDALEAPDYVLCDDNNPGDGLEVFDLTTKTAEITGGNADYIVSYYELEADAQAGNNAITTPAAYTNTTQWNQVVYARVETTEGCFDTTSFNLVVNPLPAIAAVTDYAECETSVGSGEAIFDLTSQDALITDNNANYIVEYYNSQASAQAQDPSGLVDSPYTTASTTLYVRVTDTATGCVSYGELNLQVVPVPVPGVTTPLEVCENDPAPVNLYYGTFDLTPAINEAVNGQSGITATVHETLAQAEAGTNAITGTTAYTNTNSEPDTDPADGNQTVYIRLTQNGTDCYAIAPLTLIVHPIPAIGTLTPYELCDYNNSPDGVEVFDLTTMDAQATNGVPGLTVTYYETAADADAGVNAIALPEAYENINNPNEHTIHLRLDSQFGCYSTGSFQIIVNPLPVIEQDLEPFAACEENPGEALFNLPLVDPLVTMGAEGYNVVYYETLAEAEAGLAAGQIESPYLSVAKTIYVRVIDEQTGCGIVTDLELEVLPAPIVTPPAPLMVCNDADTPEENVGEFDMTPVINDIINALGSVAVTIHETIEGATYDANPIPNTAAYTNVQNLTTGGVQVVYIRVESNTTECFDIVPLQLVVLPLPIANEPDDYHMCDDNTDGVAVFNLTTVTPVVRGTLDPSQFAVEYYTSLADAQAGVAPITNVTTYASASATLYVRLENIATGCYDIVTLELVVDPLPEAAQPTPYTLCDVNSPGDETEEFDLTTKIPEIIGTQEGINVTFHHTMADAQAGVNAVENETAYQNQQTVETLFVRVEIEATGCYRIVLLDVRVEPLPVLASLAEEVVVCDPDGNGIAEFDLEQVAQQLLNNSQNMSLAFYETEQNAQDGLFPIPNPQNYVNENPLVQILYVVATNTVTGCSSNVAELTINVQPSPVDPNVLEDLEDLTLCDEDANDQDGVAVFDLTQQNQVIEDAVGAEPGTLTIHYFTSLENAEAGAPRITSPETWSGTDGQWIYVRVEDPGTECYSTLSFQLQVGTPLELTTPPMFTVCNTELPNTPATEVFDLTTQNNTILGPQGVGQGYTVEYYLSQDDALTDTNAIANPEAFVNVDAEGDIQNPMTLFVAVTTLEGCRSYTTLTLKVLPLPTPDTTPAALELCDDNNSPDGEESFDLTLAEADIRDNDNSTTITYHVTLEDAENDTAAIPDPTNHVTATGTVYVRVEANTNNPLDPTCYQVVELEVIVNPLPALGLNGDIPPYPICEPETDGYAIFDLNTHNDEVIAGGDTTGYTFRYFRSQADAEAGFPAIPLEGWQNEVQTQQTIYVKVVNTETGCTIIGSFDIFVELEAVAHDVDDVVICDDQDGVNDGVAGYDLTQFDAQVLNGQPQGEPGEGLYVVEYYTGANPETNPEDAVLVTDPASFRNEGSPELQTIWIRVYNDGTISKCSDYTSVDIHVERLPVPVLAGGTICVDYLTGEVLRTHILDTQLDDTHTFQWYYNGALIAGATGPVYEADAAGSYTVIATSANNCVSEPIAPVVVEQSGPAAPIGVGYSVSNYFSDEQVITINVEGFGEYEYRLDDGPWQQGNIFAGVSAGPHQVQVRDVSTDNPCSGFTLTMGVNIFGYPPFFTPNGDETNEHWLPYFSDIYVEQIYIFDRYGKLITGFPGSHKGWDGNYNGRALPATDYWFILELKDGQKVKGHFALIR